VPANTEWNIPSGASVYHYHAQLTPPYLLGCFGPVAAGDAGVAECKALYSNTASATATPATGGATATSAPAGAAAPAECASFKPCTDGSNPSGGPPPVCADGTRAAPPPDGCPRPGAGRRLLQGGNQGDGCGAAASIQMGASYSVTYDLWCPCYPQTGGDLNATTSSTTTTPTPTPTPSSTTAAVPAAATSAAAASLRAVAAVAVAAVLFIIA
jgi:hypothetical protein